MRKLFMGLSVFGVALAATLSFAQPPQGDRPPREGGDAPRRDAGGEVESLLERIMTLDANKDGKIQRDEVGDSRLKPLIERADVDKDGVATKQELMAIFARENGPRGGDRGPGDRGPGDRGPGGPGGFGPGPGGFGGGPGGPGGPGGGRGFGGPPQPGQILPPFLAEMLQITEAQQQELDALQKDVDARLAKILTTEQKQRIQEMRDRGMRGPGGFGGPGGEGRGPGGDRGPGGPGGQPPREGGNRRPPSE